MRTIDVVVVLVELGFITNDEDRQRCHTDYHWQDRLCRAIIQGVRLWAS